jgi:hypothetical protein
MAVRRSATRLDLSEQRRLARKGVLLDGALADIAGRGASRCTIVDIHRSGAAVTLKKAKTLPTGASVFLLDIANRNAHEARVAWSRADRSGLSFVRSYAMDLGLPPRLNFLWRILFEAKLGQAQRAVAAGASGELALNSIGLTREHSRQMTRYAANDILFRNLLVAAERLRDV